MNSLYKALLCGVLLSLFFFSGLNLVALALFLIAGFVFYLLEPIDRFSVAASYWLLFLLDPIALWLLLNQLPDTVSKSLADLVGILIIAVSAVLYYLMLELIAFNFSNKRELVYGLVNIFIVALVFLSIVPLLEPFGSGIAGLMLFIGSALLLKEFFSFFEYNAKRSWVVSFALALIVLQLAWFGRILPLNSLNLSALLLLFYILTRDIIISHFQGRIGTVFMFRQLTFFVLFLVVIFASVSWAI